MRNKRNIVNKFWILLYQHNPRETKMTGLNLKKKHYSGLKQVNVARAMNLMNVISSKSIAMVPLDTTMFKICIQYNNEIEQLLCTKSEISVPITIPQVLKFSEFNLIGRLANIVDSKDYCDFKYNGLPQIDIFQQKYHLITTQDSYYLIFKFNLSGVRLMVFKIDDLHERIRNFHQIATQKLPVVLDLDDTLVRAVCSSSDMSLSSRVISKDQRSLVINRLKQLPPNNFNIDEIALATNVETFLDQLSRFADITICSAGNVDYVKAVCSLLDPDNSYFKDVESTRHMYDYNVIKYKSSSLPTKDLARLYPFCIPWEHHILAKNMPEIIEMSRQPVIVDDIDQAWLTNQRQQVYLMLPTSRVWDVNLELCALILKHVHEGFTTYNQSDVPHLLRHNIMVLAHTKLVPSSKDEPEEDIDDDESIGVQSTTSRFENIQDTLEAPEENAMAADLAVSTSDFTAINTFEIEDTEMEEAASEPQIVKQEATLASKIVDVINGESVLCVEHHDTIKNADLTAVQSAIVDVVDVASQRSEKIDTVTENSDSDIKSLGKSEIVRPTKDAVINLNRPTLSTKFENTFSEPKTSPTNTISSGRSKTKVQVDSILIDQNFKPQSNMYTNDPAAEAPRAIDTGHNVPFGAQDTNQVEDRDTSTIQESKLNTNNQAPSNLPPLLEKAFPNVKIIEIIEDAPIVPMTLGIDKNLPQ
eukprot:NODE_15_length_50561_cov_0.608081.p6 type:complete len:701 gc:universal NODE_15_length_50561_cov_0.608081:31262-33364(+)